MLRIGLVGIGDAGTHHARALVALGGSGGAGACVWTAVVARDANRQAKFLAEVSAPPEVVSYASLDSLLDAEVCDAVVLATPDGLHAEQAIAASTRGVHVLVEKPLALSAADAARVIQAARSTKACLRVGYHLRHHAAHRLMLARLGELVGQVRSVFVRWAWPDPSTDGWRARGEGARYWSLAALGTHGIDLALMFGGTNADARVAAVLEPTGGVDRAAEVSFALAHGALAHVSVSVVHRAVSRLVITGDKGEVEAIGSLGARGDGELLHRPPRGPAQSIAFVPENPYLAQMRAFATAAREGFTEDDSLLTNVAILHGARPL
jgi:predicted dehydrogenase